MKSLAKGYIWWLGMDAEIEELVRNCQETQPWVKKSAWVE